MERLMLRTLVTVCLLAWSAALAGAAEVKGRVVMPDSCSPIASPAVVTLEPVDPTVMPDSIRFDAAVTLKVKQQGLQFEPRVQVARVGQPIEFANRDREQHNVHSTTPGVTFSWSMAPNATQQYTPTQPGLIRLVCDVHGHMRGYVMVTTSPWAKVIGSTGTFSFKDVPDGRYVVNAWHEMGQPYRSEVTVASGNVVVAEVNLGTISLQGAAPLVAGAPVPVVAWPEVIDRISVLLTEAREQVEKPGGYDRARKLSEDAYWGEFELSDMETAVRRHLGVERAGILEAQLRGYRSALKSVKDQQEDRSSLRTRLGKLMIELSRAAEDLKRLNIFDRRDINKATATAPATESLGSDEQSKQLNALAASFVQVKKLADSGQGGEAASAMTDAYWNDFEPLERLLNTRSPQAIKALEAQFNAIRGHVDSGMAGPELAIKLDALRLDVTRAVTAANSALAGSFSPAFMWSLLTVLREGVEVILLLSMLIALAVKAGQPRAMTAIWWGIGAAVVASAATAGGLSLLVGSTQGRTREIVEGAVMMLAAAILFYVSYWLISQSQAKRWADFLKQQAARGASAGGLGTLALTSFLAVYREGAETTLLYQAMISTQGGSRDGLMGLAVGLILGVALLAVVAVALRLSSVRLPIRPFFKVTGYALFAMAVVFAGNGVFELQSAGLIKVTPVSWLGLGVPMLGIHPNVQTLVIQGFLLFGAAMTLLVPIFEPVKGKTLVQPASARVGVNI